MCVPLLLKAHCWLPIWGGGDNIQTLYSGQPGLGLTDWHSLVPPQLLRSRVSPTPHPTSLHACCCALLLSVPGRHECFLVQGPVATAQSASSSRRDWLLSFLQLKAACLQRGLPHPASLPPVLTPRFLCHGTLASLTLTTRWNDLIVHLFTNSLESKLPIKYFV